MSLVSGSHYRRLGERIVVESGRVIEVGKIFEHEREVLEDRLEAASRRGDLLRFNHEDSEQPFLLISRRNSWLQGPQASFYQDGSPNCLLDYKAGKRESALLSWDDQMRPLVFAQYGNGLKHGFRCLYKACSEECTEGHLWLVQEWRKGVIQAAYLIPEDGKTHSFQYRYGNLVSRNNVQEESELALALAKLEEFDETTATNEKMLMASLAQLDHQERQKSIMLRQASLARYRNQFLAVRGCSGGG